jgi:hypothetical protein
MTSAERLAVAMIARLSPPLISGIIMARARIPSSGIWKAMARRVSPERKLEGASTLKTIAASKIKAASIVTVGSRPSKSATDVRVVGEGVGVMVASDGIADGPLLLALGGNSRGADTDENDDAGDEAERVG